MPSGELARLHLRSAVTHLLQHPPVQGKYALERLVREVNSEFFPDDVKKATASLSSGPLKRPRESLVRNFIVVLLKQVLAGDTERKLRRRMYAALGAIRSLHPAIFEATLQEKLTPLFRAVEDSNLSLVISLLRNIDDCWHQLAVDVQHRVENYVVDLPADNLDDLDFLFEFEPLKKNAATRLARATKKELHEHLGFGIPCEAAEKLIDIYLASKSFAEANEWAKTMTLYAFNFSATQQQRIIEGIAGNSEISLSFEVGSVLSSLRQAKKLSSSEFELLLISNDLEKYALADPK